MNKAFVFVFILITNLTVFANTGWSGKVTDNGQLESLIQDQIVMLYDSQCSQNSLLEASVPMYIDLERVDNEFDYLGATAPKYTINMSIYSVDQQTFINQTFTTQVTYNSLTRDLKVELVESSFSCID